MHDIVISLLLYMYKLSSWILLGAIYCHQSPYNANKVHVCDYPYCSCLSSFWHRHPYFTLQFCLTYTQRGACCSPITVGRTHFLDRYSGEFGVAFIIINTPIRWDRSKWMNGVFQVTFFGHGLFNHSSTRTKEISVCTVNRLLTLLITYYNS